MAWNEVAANLFHRRYQPLDVSVCVIRGADGFGVVDTRSSPRQADELRADLRELGDLPVRWVVNTHAHFDHCFGNQRFTPIPIYGHVRTPAHLGEFGQPELTGWIAAGGQQAEEWREVTVTPPTHLVEGREAIAVGDRAVELIHLGRGHTDTDLVVHVPDAAAWLVGDLVEESGPPSYGPDSFPLEWPGTVARLLALAGTGDVLVPGHGQPVDLVFARAQQAQLAGVASLIRELHAAGISAREAVTVAGSRCPLPISDLAAAVAAAYAQLGAAVDAG
jgi:glyoxylase-like metal-dependent hydrolase (beta-lactamase superfamily II)